jgi:Lrp/AsnC family transcriptional regulator, regulator for asnA, asnC and gidA
VVVAYLPLAGFDSAEARLPGNQWNLPTETTESLAEPRSMRQYRNVSTRNGTAAHLDDVSKRIIEQLQEDGRRPYASIGKAVGLSEAAVRQRVQRMLDSGVMQIVAVTDPLQVGFSRQAMIGLRVQGDLSSVADALAAMTEVDYVVVTAGSFDLLAEAVCEDDDALLHLINSRIRTIPGVKSTETFVYLKLRKQLYNWGTR